MARYHSRVHNARERLRRDERKARGERDGNEKAADDILRRILPPDHKARREMDDR